MPLTPVLAAIESFGLASERLPPLSPLVLSVPAGCATLLLMAHSVRHRGSRATAVFCVLCVGWYMLKEYAIVARALQAHAYTVVAPMFTVLGIPIILPVGYVFTGYVSWYFAERIVERLPGCAGRLFPLVAVWLLMTSSIAYVMEVVGAVGRWWEWEADDGLWRNMTVAARDDVNSGTIHPIITYAPVYGWALYMLPIATLFLGFEFSPLKAIRLKAASYVIGLELYFIACLYNGLFPFVMLLFGLTALSRFPVTTRRDPVNGALRFAPQIGVAAMLATSFYVDVIHARDASLLESWIPLLALLAVAHAGSRTVVVAAVLSAALLATDLAISPRAHHGGVYTGLLVLMAALRGWRGRRPARPPWPVTTRLFSWLVRGAPISLM